MSDAPKPRLAVALRYEKPRAPRVVATGRGALGQKIIDTAIESGVPVQDVLVSDASRRTTALNAYVSGFGATRRIVVYDTVLAQLPDDEVESIVAHELGHVVNGDVLTGTVSYTLQLREKERDLLFVGDQFRRAIGEYYEKAPGGVKVYPKKLEDLLRDNRYPGVQRWLRKIPGIVMMRDRPPSQTMTHRIASNPRDRGAGVIARRYDVRRTAAGIADGAGGRMFWFM